ncbi:T-cell receptor gamma chain V domain 1 [Aix galericulata]|nr:T-cell receptor gamma chain V domain 1 [Aix galericulata]
MMLLAALVATAAWYDGFAQEIPIQTPISITKFKKTARMYCEIKNLPTSFDSTVIHWYKRKENEAPERLLFFAEGRTSVESGFQKDRYRAERVSDQNRCVLMIKDVIPDDAGMYYCAYWDPHNGTLQLPPEGGTSSSHVAQLSLPRGQFPSASLNSENREL